jgi:hypothetical protein
MNARSDIVGYYMGCRRLENIIVSPTGVARRCPGLRRVDALPGQAVLHRWEFSTDQAYVVAIGDLAVRIRETIGGAAVGSAIVTPWTLAQALDVDTAQFGDVMFLVHPEIDIHRLQRGTGGTFSLVGPSLPWARDDTLRFPPMSFFGEDIRFTPSALTGSITLTASAAYFTSNMASQSIIMRRNNGNQVRLTTFVSATVMNATVLTPGGLSSTAESTWAEQAFSVKRGYPTSVALHQNRLVFGGSRDKPNSIWFSRAGSLFDFDEDIGATVTDASSFQIEANQAGASPINRVELSRVGQFGL